MNYKELKKIVDVDKSIFEISLASVLSFLVFLSGRNLSGLVT